MDIKRSIYWAWLAAQKDVGPSTFYSITLRLGDPRDVYAMALRTPEELAFLGGALRNSLAKSTRDGSIEKLHDNIIKKGLKLITRDDDEYPLRLAAMDDAPPVLYVKGAAEKLNYLHALAIVGARRCTEYGKETANSFAKAFAEYGACVISGMAIGIDSAAHRGALESRSEFPTVAVLAGGADKATPSCNRELYERVAARGAVVSEHPPGYNPSQFSFPVRNRIMAGLSDAVLVVESKIKSGTAYTVNACLDIGRDVYAVPGRLNDVYSSGPLNLIKSGACVALDPYEMLEQLGWLENNDRGQIASAVVKAENEGANDPVSAVLDNLTGDEKRVLAALVGGIKTKDELVEYTGIQVNKILSLLTILQTRGIIKRNEKGGYSL